MTTTDVATETWEQQFAPVVEAGNVQGRTLAVRPSQAAFGQSIIDALAARKNLVAECPVGTGKSLAYLIPAIHRAQRGGDGSRTVVSTETLALQDQLILRDLPFLHGVYGGFTFRVLKGRSNYLCLNRASANAVGNATRGRLVKQLRALHTSTGFGDGELADVRGISMMVSTTEWPWLAGEALFCAEAKCKADVCYSTRAREKAAAADIVVVNHSLLRTDADMKRLNLPPLLGEYGSIVVDEAHTLESVLIDGWTEEVTPWSLNAASAALHEGLDSLSGVCGRTVDGRRLSAVFDDVEEGLKAARRFFYQLALQRDAYAEWDRVTCSVREYSISGRPSGDLVREMRGYEEDTPVRLAEAVKTLLAAEADLVAGMKVVNDGAVPSKAARRIRKGLRVCRKTREALETIGEATLTKDGVVERFGVPYGVIARGRSDRRFGEQLLIDIVPLEVSRRAAATIWKGHVAVLVSATLSDPTKSYVDLSYVPAALGVTDYETLTVSSPFDFATRQLVYVTPGVERDDVAPISGARFSLSELKALVDAADGRSLILFTSKVELEYVADELRLAAAHGEWSHETLVQTADVDKQQLFDDFAQREDSVLLASKSAFTGVNFPGRTCSLVALVKFPLPRWDPLCQLRLAHWRSHGFPQWYEREALLVFAQASGRLIRAETDRGVVALLDGRVVVPGERVRDTALLGVAALGSPVTRSLGDVKAFLAG